jgi:hypothetical protein
MARPVYQIPGVRAYSPGQASHESHRSKAISKARGAVWLALAAGGSFRLNNEQSNGADAQISICFLLTMAICWRSDLDLCVVCLPAIRASQRHSTHHLLHYRSPFGFHFCFRSVPSGFVQRTGCSACGSGYPHQTPGLVGSPHVHSSCLIPVSSTGLLIKCLHFIGMTWAFAQVRPHVALRGRLRAVLGYPRPWGCQPR